MSASLSDSSIQQYDVYIRKWFQFCTENDWDCFVTSIPNVMFFLTKLYENGAQYSSLNTCRSALALILGSHIGEDDRIKRFFRGIFRSRPPLPKYHMTWDTSLVLNHLSGLYPNNQLSIEQISYKLVTLLALITAHRVQTLSKININNIEIFTNKVTIKIPDIIKTSRLGSFQPILSIPFFEEKPEICPGKTLLAYVEISKPLRKDITSLFIGLKKPHKAVGSQTLSRWIKNALSKSGIDVSIFTAHSTRHAATSAARRLGISLDTIRRTAGWSASSSTFFKFYNRTLTSNVADDSFARSIISNVSE